MRTPCARRGDRRRRGRRLDALSSGQEGLVRRRPARAQGADLRLDLARRRPAAALQHELLGRPDPQILGRASTRRWRRRPARMSASRVVSNIRLARTRDRWDEFMYYAGVAETIGVKVNVLTPDELKEIWPLCETDGIIGAHPASRRRLHPAGRPDPGAGQGRARRCGAEINRNTTVTAIEQTPSGEWLVEDRQGRHHLRARRLRHRQFRPADRRDGRPRRPGHPGRAPVHRHRAASGDPGAPAPGPARDGRAARGGLLLVHARGGGRPAARPLREGRARSAMSTGRREESEYELFQEDLERLMPHIETAIARVPAFGEVGIKKVYNGAIAYTPDGSPIVGPAWDLKNFWLNEGHSFGVTAAGGAGWQLAEWIVDGEPTIDMMGVDPRRFGPYATRRLPQGQERGGLCQRLHAALSGRGARRGAAAEDDALLRPDEGARRRVRLRLWLGAAELVRAGGLRRSTARARQADDVLTNHNHRAGRRTGEVQEIWSFRRSNYFEHVGNEMPQRHRGCRPAGHVALRQDAGDRPRRARPGSIRSSPTASRRSSGRIALCHLLTPQRRRALRVHRLRARRRAASTSSRPARWSATTTTRCGSSCRRTAA